jgi:hypothetical protein
MGVQYIFYKEHNIEIDMKFDTTGLELHVYLEYTVILHRDLVKCRISKYNA